MTNLEPLADAPPSSREPAHVSIHQRGTTSAVFVNDHDVANACTAVTVALQAALPPVVTLTMTPGAFEYDGNATVKIDDRTAAALAKLGWTAPPPEPAPLIEWGYGFVDSGGVCGPTQEATARRKASEDLSVVLLRRTVASGGEPGEWLEVNQ
ncbi:MAG: hypothetical protein JWQ81_8588 [Amycolatopsis sp.]|uniref:hypothetical protein n=1 Tax=Amycolatopsis sp. TaxID=37632 RepID=UPI00260AFFFA|nr:hypothetical protein [Amycolatopsis sp.]MCU1687849.1 hypothetical protein [Amycolatopsis sp.]